MCPRVKPIPIDNHVTNPAKLWILLVGVNQYQDRANLASLQYSALDCQGLGKALTEATADFAAREVIIHHDFVTQPPLLATVEQSIEQVVSSASEQDTILFYFSGHGVLDAKSQQVVLCLADTNTEKLLNTGLPLNTLLQQLSNCAASQQLVWLDACHSGAMTLRGTPTSLADPSSQLVKVLRHQAAQSKGFYALLSCDQTQQSWEFPELGHGVFTYYLMRGLRGEAADTQGIIEADALYQYVYYQTLRYIDKTNQQIRLVNQQKSSRGESKLQSEFPLQTPKRIVEGFGKVVLGKRSSCNLEVNSRQALVVDGGFKTNRTTLALSQLWQSAGDFKLKYFPQTNEPWSKVKGAIATCLDSQTQSSSDFSTALLYLKGEIVASQTGETWLTLQDNIRLSSSWLRKMLQNSRAMQQIVILDCLGSDSGGEWIEDLRLEVDRGQCLIVANAPLDYPQQFADVVLKTLQNADSTGLTIAAWISQLQIALAGTKITLQVWLSGSRGVIELLPAKSKVQEKQSILDLGICPYMGLQSFDEDSAEYFYGRTTLVQKLINQISHKPSVAVVGASGSGKSSVVQAGLLAKLRQGKQIPNSDRWWLGYFCPGQNPIQALAKLLASKTKPCPAKERLQIEGLLYQGVEGFVRWLRTRPEPMVVLVVDQFEEIFTLAGESERQEFIELIVGAVKYAGDRFKLILTIRADFVAACLEIAELAQILQKNSVLVPHYLIEADYRSAITKPAAQVGLKVESGLVEVLLQDLDRSAGDLPLLQFALQQLWERRDGGKLTLEAYQELEGIKGALERQAQAVYDALDPKSQECARWIFLNLTQLGEGTEDTRRRVTKSDLVVSKYPATLVNQTLRILTNAKLLVVNLDDGNIGQSRNAANPPDNDELFLEAMRQEATVEVVHEILIRHWSSLRWWLEENRSRLRSQRQIEQAAILWIDKNRQDDFLLRGIRLAEAEEIFIKYTDELSNSAKEYVATCIDAREAQQRETKKRLRQAQLTAMALGVLGLAATAFGISAYRQQAITQIENIASLAAVAEAQLLSNQQLESLTTSVKAGQQLKRINSIEKALVGSEHWRETRIKTTAALQQSIYGTQELNRLEGHSQQVAAVNVSQDGKLIATYGNDETIKIWQKDGTLLKTLAKKQRKNNPLVVSLGQKKIEIANPIYLKSNKSISTKNGNYSITANYNIVEFKQTSNVQPSILFEHTQPVSVVALSQDKNLLATATTDGRIHIWHKDGILQQILPGHTGEIFDLKFVTNNKNSDKFNTIGDRYQIISTGVDKTVRIWQVFNRYQNNAEGIYGVTVSPHSANTYATAETNDKINLWHKDSENKQKLIHTLLGHDNAITQIKYSPDGKLIASASWDRTIRLWNAETGELINTVGGYKDGINSIAFTPDNQTLISGDEAKEVKIWNITNQPKLSKTLTGHTDSIKAVTVSPDGNLIASAGYDNTIKLWTIKGELLQTIAAHNLAITSLQFTPDSKTLVSASWDNTAKVWLIKNAGKNSQLLHTLTGHQDGITTISLNSDGTLLATGSGDRTIKLWDINTGELIKNLRGHTSQINSLAFTNNDQSIISGEEQQGLFWWNLNLDNLLEQGCDRLSDYLATNPNLKPSEKELCQ